MIRSFLFVGIGGALGSIARYGTTLLAKKLTTAQLPWGTFAVNMLGCLFIGLLAGLALRSQWLQQHGMLLLATGFCGGFTTFSALALENVQLMQRGGSVTAAAYTIASLVLGLMLCRLGLWLAN